MTLGPGRYDFVAAELMTTLEVQDGLILLVFGGRWGNGSSVKITKELALKLPELFRAMALEQEADNRRLGLTP